MLQLRPRLERFSLTPGMTLNDLRKRQLMEGELYDGVCKTSLVTIVMSDRFVLQAKLLESGVEVHASTNDGVPSIVEG
jgi:hypothetical protein